MRVLFSLTLLFVLPLSTMAQKFTDPVKYNDFIVGNQNQIIEEMLLLNASLDGEGETAESVHTKRKHLVETINSSIKSVEKLSAFEGNVDLRNSAVSLFKFYKKMFEVDYAEMIDILYSGEITAEDVEKITVIAESVAEEEVPYDDAFQKAQKAFATKYNILLQENELQEDIDDL